MRFSTIGTLGDGRLIVHNASDLGALLRLFQPWPEFLMTSEVFVSLAYAKAARASASASSKDVILVRLSLVGEV